jgi:hypothetical protein
MSGETITIIWTMARTGDVQADDIFQSAQTNMLDADSHSSEKHCFGKVRPNPRDSPTDQAAPRAFEAERLFRSLAIGGGFGRWTSRAQRNCAFSQP